MKCPVCNDVRMREVEKDTIIIDTCPDCKGVWLDRGELEKITQGLREDESYYTQSRESDDRSYRDSRDFSNKYRNENDDKYARKSKRKKSMIDILSKFL